MNQTTNKIETRGRKPGTKNAPRVNPEKATRVPYERKPRAPLSVDGMGEGSRVVFNIAQAKASLLFAGKVNVDTVYKISSMIAAKNTHSGQNECTLQTLGGTLIGFVALQYLKPEDS